MAKIETGAKEVILKINITPTITIHMGKALLGSITFDNMDDTGKFLRKLSTSIKQIIEKLNIAKVTN